MISESRLNELIEQGLTGTDKFLTLIKIRPGNKIMVFIDGDQAVTIDDCVKLSRFIESGLDRETEDFELQVSTYGADQPLKMPRQFPKHIGRTLAVKREGTLVKGKLESCDDKGIRMLLPADKKKKKEEETIFIPYGEIEEAKIELTFK